MKIKELEAHALAIAPIIKSMVLKSIEDLRIELTAKINEIKLIEPINGIDGLPGQDGKDGEPGQDGKDGIDGKDGAPGLDGRDALQLEILPTIDETKSYPRGTYAKHNGGLWRSFEQTHEMRGWECIVDGIASFEFEVSPENEREYKAVAILSSGIETIKNFYIPAMIYRGIWEAKEYHVGDNVTWGGSQWYCEQQTSDKPGEPGSKGWKLSVKRGRDGKNGINGKDAPGAVKL